MKKINVNCYHAVVFTLIVLALFSCKRENIPTINDYDNKIPDNVHLSDYSNSSITVAWDRIEDAASYTVQLLNSIESDTPIDEYTTVSKDFHAFDGLNEIMGYYVRVRANFNTFKNPIIGDWVYVMNGQNPGRVMPKYGFVDEDFEAPEPEPEEVLYSHFPEGFENIIGPRKGAYASTDPELYASGEWEMFRCQTTSAGSLLHKVDKYAAMISPNIEGYVAMSFDLPKGASKLTFVTGVATSGSADVSNMPITLSVFYSIDEGNNWNKIDDILIDDIDMQYTPEYNDLGIEGPVRFKFQKDNSGARPIVDQIAVYYLE